MLQTGMLRQVAAEAIKVDELLVHDDKLMMVVATYHTHSRAESGTRFDIEIRCSWQDDSSSWGNGHKSYYFNYGQMVTRVQWK